MVIEEPDKVAVVKHSLNGFFQIVCPPFKEICNPFLDLHRRRAENQPSEDETDDYFKNLLEVHDTRLILDAGVESLAAAASG